MGIRFACRRLAAPAYLRSLLFTPFILFAVACSENATEPVAPDMDAAVALDLAGAQLSGLSGPILSGIAANKCIDTDRNGAVINSCDSSSDQRFTFRSNGSIVRSDGACLAGNDRLYAGRVGTAKCDGGSDQRWTATKAGEIRSTGGKCIGVAGNNSANGTKLVLWSCNGTPSQRWTSTGSIAVSANAVALSVSNVKAASGKSYKVFNAGTKLGSITYSDRDYKLSSSIPAAINGATYIQTANNDKFASLGSSSFLTFDVNTDVDVYVAYDNDKDLIRPSWLTGSFTNTGTKVYSSYHDLNYSLYRKSFAKGRVTLGANTTRSTDGSMYLVFIVAKGGSSTSPTTPEAGKPAPPVEGPSLPGGSTGGKHSGIFVSPSGSGSASGSESSPMSLSAALSGGNGRIQAGDTVWLRNGTYKGSFRSTLSGTSSAPIVVRQYPGERATIDGNMTIQGRYTWYWGFEVANTNTGTKDVMGINSLCPGCRFINLSIHDHSGNGLGMWSEGPDQEAYGNVIYNNGFHGSTSSSYGHGIYAQNASGSKKLTDNILVNQFGYGVHIYTESGAMNNFTVDGNVAVNSGQGDGMDYQVGGTAPVKNLVFTDNMSYRNPDRRGNTARLGYNWGPTNSGAVVTGNYLVGTLLRYFWSGMTFSGNTILTGSTPGATKVVVEPNKYEAGRANVIVYNWGRQGAVSVNLSNVLRSGDRYEVRNAQNYYGSPVASGSYSGGSISIPVNSTSPARSITGKSTSSTSSEFAVFVVVKK